jgi:hypothetical protein
MPLVLSPIITPSAVVTLGGVANAVVAVPRATMQTAATANNSLETKLECSPFFVIAPFLIIVDSSIVTDPGLPRDPGRETPSV